MSEEKVTYNACQGWGCHEQCVFKTYTEDGVIKRAERAVIPGTDIEMSAICQKGIASIKLPYADSRPIYPMKRVGERGEGKFERISWDQAMDEIGTKLNEIRDKYGSRSVLLNNYPCGIPVNMCSLNLLLSDRFANVFGATLLPWVPCDQEACFPTQVGMGSTFGYIGYDTRHFRDANYIIIWGGNPLGWTRCGKTTEYVMEAQEKGAKIVTIGTIFDSTAAKSDQFVRIKSGTDAVLALSMVNVMFRDNIWDRDFMIKHTVAPFLVRQDNGKFLRESDIIAGGDAQKYVFLNTVPEIPVAVGPHQQIPEGKCPQLFAETMLNGIPCKTALSFIKDEAACWTPKEQEKMTGVPAEVVEQLAHEYTETENAVIWQYCGIRYLNAGHAGRAINLVAILSGQMGKGIGGLGVEALMGEYPVALNDAPIVFPDGDPGQIKGTWPQSLKECFDEGFPYKALLNVVGNPVQIWPNRALWTETILPKLELIVVHEIRMSETALFADYILPDASTLERPEILIPRRGYAMFLEPAIKPRGEARPAADFWRELSKRVGIGEYFDKTTDEWMELWLQSEDPAIATLDQPLTLERLKREKFVKLNVPDGLYNVWGNLDFPTDSGKIEIYSEHLADVGAAVAMHVEPVIRGPLSATYPLQLLVGRHRVFMQSQFSDLPVLRQLAGDKPHVRMNPKDAEARGLKNGDEVEVFNHRGAIKCKVFYSNALPSGMVHVWFAYTAAQWGGTPPQALMTPEGTEETSDPVIEKWLNVMKQRTVVPWTMDWDSHVGGGWETLWDNLCDVRKA